MHKKILISLVCIGLLFSQGRALIVEASELGRTENGINHTDEGPLQEPELELEQPILRDVIEHVGENALPNSASGNDIVHGSPDIQNDGDWWRNINHLLTRRIIENWLNDLLSGNSLGYRAGDTFTTDIANLNTSNVDIGGEILRAESPTMANALHTDVVNDEYWYKIDGADTIEASRDYWMEHRYRSAFNSASSKYLHVHFTDNKWTVADGEIEIELNGPTLSVRRLKTNISQEIPEQLHQNADVSYENNYNGADADVVSGDLYHWSKRDKDSRSGGFSPLMVVNLNKISPLTVTQDLSKGIPVISQHTTLEESVDFANYLEIEGVDPNSTIQISSETPNKVYDEAGNQVAQLKITEQLDGEERSVSVSLTFEVDTELTATAQAQDISLGEVLTAEKMKTLISEVKKGEEILPATAYDVFPLKTIDVSTVGSQSVKVIVEMKETKQRVIVDVPIQVKWADTIYLKGEENRSIGAFSLLQQADTMYLAATLGEKTLENEETAQIHSAYQGKKYYGISLFHPVDQTMNIMNSQPFYQLDAFGEENILDKLASFGQNGKLDASIGDILQVFHEEPEKNKLMVQEIETEQHENLKDVYYELTKNGYHTLHINQLIPQSIVIKNGTTKEELEQKILAKTLDLKEYQNIVISGYHVYPDTLKDGKQEAQVIATETLTNGKKIEQIYTIPFEIRPVITEEFYSEDGTFLTSKQTVLTENETFKPDPDHKLTIEDTRYRYQGWLAGNGDPKEDEPLTGTPEPVGNTTTIKYIYENTDKMIHVSMPIEMIFSSSSLETKAIESNQYRMINQSNNETLKISLIKFDVTDSAGVHYLKQDEAAPLDKGEFLRLNLQKNKDLMIDSLNETTKNVEIGSLLPHEELGLSFNGFYYGELTEEGKQLQNEMIFKFTIE